MAQQAEGLGVEIYPGFPAADIVFGENGEVKGVTTGDMGVAKDGHHKSEFTPGMNLLGKYTLFAEGARGSLSKRLGAHYKLHEGRDPQKFGIGLKELWEFPKDKHKPGLRCTLWAGRWTIGPVAGFSCIIGARICARSASSFTSTIPIRSSLRSMNSSA
jgi:flavin-dependent dehydrogenase